MENAGVPLVWVLADNPDAEAFYAASGFERGGEGDQRILMLLETKADGDRTRDGDHAARLHRHGRMRRGGGYGH
jgi:hypothetical protein